MYIHMCIHMYIHVYTYVYACVSACVCTSVCTCVYTFVHHYVCNNIFIFQNFQNSPNHGIKNNKVRNSTKSQTLQNIEFITNFKKLAILKENETTDSRKSLNENIKTTNIDKHIDKL